MVFHTTRKLVEWSLTQRNSTVWNSFRDRSNGLLIHEKYVFVVKKNELERFWEGEIASGIKRERDLFASLGSTKGLYAYKFNGRYGWWSGHYL